MYRIVMISKQTGCSTPVLCKGRDLIYKSKWEANAIISYLKKHDSLVFLDINNFSYALEIVEDKANEN